MIGKTDRYYSLDNRPDFCYPAPVKLRSASLRLLPSRLFWIGLHARSKVANHEPQSSSLVDLFSPFGLSPFSPASHKSLSCTTFADPFAKSFVIKSLQKNDRGWARSLAHQLQFLPFNSIRNSFPFNRLRTVSVTHGIGGTGAGIKTKRRRERGQNREGQKGRHYSLLTARYSLPYSGFRSECRSIPSCWHFLYRWLRSRPSARATLVM
jgi:hypothetical protein